MDTFTAAVVQTASVAFDPDRTIEKLADYSAQAAGRGAKLVVFPECMNTGYLFDSAEHCGRQWQTKPEGKKSIHWLVEAGQLPINFLASVDPAIREKIFSHRKSGQARINELFRLVKGRIGKLAATDVETVRNGLTALLGGAR